MPSVYYAVCPGTGGCDDKKTGSPTITIASGVATLSVAQTGNIGQGFRITYDTSKVCFISQVNSSTSFNVVTATGGTPSNEASAVTVNSIRADYASLSAAEAGASDATHLNTSNLTTGSHILNLVCYAGASADTTACTISGYTTSADYYINVYVANGGTQSISNNRHAGVWDTSKYYLYNTGAHILLPQDADIHLTGLQIHLNRGTSSARYCIYGGGNSSYHYYDSLILKCESTGAGQASGMNLVGSGETIYVKNTIIYGQDNAAYYGAYNDGSGSVVWFYNCTIFHCASGISADANWHVQNCAVFNNTDDFVGALDVDYTASDDNDISGTGNVDLADSAASWNAQFADYDATNPDVRLVGNSLLLMTGIGPSSDSNVPTTDIAGNPRAGTLTSIGAFHKELTDVYYACSMYGIGNLRSSSSLTCSITDSVATLSEAQTANIGVGCRFAITAGGIMCMIKSVTDSTHFEIVDKYGLPVPDYAAGTIVSAIGFLDDSLNDLEAGASGANLLNTADLTSANVRLNLCCYYDHVDYSADTTSLTVDGYTTDSTRYVKIFTPRGLSFNESINNQRHAGSYNDEKYQWNSTAARWEIHDHYTQIIGIQLLSNASEHRLLIQADYCIIDGMINMPLSSTGSDYGIRINGGSTEGAWHRADVRNSIVTGADRGICRYYDASGTILYVHNCTVYNCTVTAGIADRKGSHVVATNCVVHTCADDFNGTGMTITFCASEDNDGSDSVNLSGVAASAIWTDAANGNFSLVSSSPLIGEGTDLSAYFTTDIIGTTRSTWDIGAFEYVASGGSGPKWNTITPAKWNGVDWSNLKWNGM